MADDRRDTERSALYGWGSDFPDFRAAPPRVIRGRLEEIILEASPQQISAWDASIPQLQREVGEVIDRDDGATEYTAILEYELPMESRRPDVIFLLRPTVMVLELKGKQAPTVADLDQAAGYARELKCYHRECHGRPVVPVLVATEANGYLGEKLGVHVSGPDALDGLIASRGAFPEPRRVLPTAHTRASRTRTVSEASGTLDRACARRYGARWELEKCEIDLPVRQGSL